jgi:predicted flap endonuclease-1-like 5' DNA nuclease
MEWWVVLIIFIVIVLIVWWLLSRQTEGDAAEVHEAVAVPAVKDDLTKIEGIGPKVQGLLNAAGITTYAQLAAKTPEELDAIMDAAGSIYKAMDEGSWPRQAALAAEGKWEELEKLQDELVGGK